MLKLPSKEELKDVLIEKKLVILVILVFIGVISAAVFLGVINTPLTDPMASFQAPTYIPEGYVKMENTTTAGVDKSYTFVDEKNGNYFVVAAIKDLNKSEYSELAGDQLFDEMGGMKTVKEEMTVEGHPVDFKIVSMDIMGISMNMFHVTWTCTQTGLHIIATGKIGANKENMKKMVQSIQCHTEKQWKII